MKYPLKAFVSCAPALEELLTQELTELGFTELFPGYAGVYVKVGSLTDIYRINYASRIASRVLLPVAIFPCRNKEDLYEAARAIDWSSYQNIAQTFAIDANVHHPGFRNSLFAAQVVKDAICDFWRDLFGKRPNVDTYNPDVQINLFMTKDRAVISMDSSGTPLHKRGYRLESGEAPLQETLAAALLRLGDFKSQDVVCDPCCGSGTLLIEAALIASKTAPGYLRQKWGFMNLPDFDQLEWLKVKNEIDALRVTLPSGHIFGCDINKNAVRIAKTNIRAAGFVEQIAVAQGDLRSYEPPAPPTFLITNPPYGLRLDDTSSLKELYRSIGDFMKRKMAKPSKGCVLTGSLPLSKEIGLSAKRRHVLDSGGVEVRLLTFEVW